MNDLTESHLKLLSGGKFQQLVADFLPLYNNKFNTLQNPGNVEGTEKTRKGRPDMWVLTNEEFIFIEATVDENKKKLISDFSGNLDYLIQIKDKILTYVCVLNYEPFPQDILELKKICNDNNIYFELVTSRTLANHLNTSDFQELRLKYLGLQPTYHVFLTTEQFKTTLKNKSAKLPLPKLYVGRELDFDKCFTKLIKSRLLIIDGDPGTGKTRFILELGNRIKLTEKFKEHNIRFLREFSGSILDSIPLELDKRHPFAIFVDDAARLNNLSDLFELIIGPYSNPNNVLIFNTRKYNTEVLLNLARKFSIEDVTTHTLNTMSNADINTMISGNPYNVTNEDIRRRVVIIAKGNPRLALVLTEVSKLDPLSDDIKPLIIYERYFEDVFTDIASLLDTDKDKILLGLISALRIIDTSNIEIISLVKSLTGIDNNTELQLRLSNLKNKELLDSDPENKTYRIFDDSISEYIFFRFFFHDNKIELNFWKTIYDPFMPACADKILENLVVISNKGYSSKSFESTVTTLSYKFRHTLTSSEDTQYKSTILRWLKEFTLLNPDINYQTISNYVETTGISNLSEEDAESILATLKNVMYNIPQYFIPSFTLIKNIYVYLPDTLKQVAHKAEEHLKSVTSYSRPQQINDTQVQWHYGPQQLIINEIESAISEKNYTEKEINLYVLLLSILSRNHFESHYSDFVDDNKYILQSGGLHFCDSIKDIRSKTFNSLKSLYFIDNISGVLRKEILEAYDSAFQRLLPIGGIPNADLLKFDANEIVGHIHKIAQKETNYYLLNQIDSIASKIIEHSNTHVAADILTTIRTDNLIEYQKCTNSFKVWDHYTRDLDEEDKLRNEFTAGFVDTISEETVASKLSTLQEYYSASLLGERSDSNFENIFYHLGVTNRNDVAERVISYIEQTAHILLPFVKDILLGLERSYLPLRLKISQLWCRDNDLNKAIIISSSYSWHLQRDPTTEEESIFEYLISLDNKIIDDNLIRGLVWFEKLKSDWVSLKLCILSKRIDERTFGNLLMHLEPNHKNESFGYKIYRTSPEILKHIVFDTVRFARISNDSFSYHFKVCLCYLCDNDPNILIEYFDERLKYQDANYTADNFFYYDVVPHYGFDLATVKTSKQYEQIINLLFKKESSNSNQHFSWIQIFSLIHTNRDHFLSEPNNDDIDSVLINSVSNLINGSKTEFKLSLKILHEIKSWNSWFELVKKIITKSKDPWVWRDLYSDLYTGSYSGRFPDLLLKRMELLTALKEKESLTDIIFFLDGAIILLTEMRNNPNKPGIYNY